MEELSLQEWDEGATVSASHTPLFRNAKGSQEEEKKRHGSDLHAAVIV